MSSLAVQRESWRDSFRCRIVCSSPTARPIHPVPVYSEVRAWADGWVALYPTQMCTHIYAGVLAAHLSAMRVRCKLRRASLEWRCTAPRCEPASRADGPSRGSAIVWRIGAAACVFDPVHAVDLQAVQVGLVHLLHLFPVQADYEVERAEYNQNIRSAFERIRDFQSAHYVLNRFGGSTFWTRAREQLVSPELAAQDRNVPCARRCGLLRRRDVHDRRLAGAADRTRRLA